MKDRQAQPDAENLLRMHPGVHEAAVIHDDERNQLTAFVVLDDTSQGPSLDRDRAELATLAKWRKASDLSQLTKEADFAPLGFNTIGWNSSYTRRPIPDVIMRDWTEAAAAGILRLAPKSVFEIGCGTGLLTIKIAPHCDRYVASDFAPRVLNRLREQHQTVSSLAERLEILERRADNFEGIDPESFDAVVLNSVVQYFPNATYLKKVLEKAVRIVRPGGHVFVGDVRSLPLLPVFASSVELLQAANATSLAELRSRILRRINREPELILSPTYFHYFRQCFPNIAQVEIRPLRGRTDSEMTRYRYEAILHVGRESGPPVDCPFLNWADHNWKVSGIRSILLEHPSEPLGIKCIQNPRIEKDLANLDALQAADVAQTVGELRAGLEQCAQKGIHPRDLIDLEEEGLGFAVFISWAACRPDGSFDACFIPLVLLGGVTEPAIDWPKPEASAYVRLTNAPGKGKLRDELLGQLIAHCRQNLPADLLPREIRFVDLLHRTPDDNVVDESALLGSIRRNSF